MNTKRKVSVQIEGRSYALITADDEKYVQGVADDVIAQIKKIVTSTNHLDTRDCAILAALNFAMTATRLCAIKKSAFQRQIRLFVKQMTLISSVRSTKPDLQRLLTKTLHLPANIKDLKRKTSN